MGDTVGVIYQITNNTNGKIYVGQKKCNGLSHFFLLEYYGSGIAIRDAINKLGINCFSRKILFIGFSKLLLNEMEKHYIKLFECKTPNGYNITDGGERSNTMGMLGKHMSEEAKKKMSAAATGENNSFYGKHHSEETIRKYREDRRGRKPWKYCGELKIHPWLGKKHSVGTKLKMSITRTKYWENKRREENNGNDQRYF